MKFFKNLKLIVGLSFMVILLVNVVMYFLIPHSVILLDKEINCLYIQVVFILLEIFMLSGIYGKKQGLTICLLYFLLIAVNLAFLVMNVEWELYV